MANWKCIKNCGACCQLNPDERPDLEEYLTPAQLSQYLSMVGEEGWCIEQFAIDCCHEHIEDLYGEDSLEMNSYRQQVG